MLVLPSQTPGLIEALGITRFEAVSEALAVEATGKRFGGAAAVNRVLGELGGAWMIVARVYRIPVFRWLEDRAYGWIAENRSRFAMIGVTPECARPDVRCQGAK